MEEATRYLLNMLQGREAYPKIAAYGLIIVLVLLILFRSTRRLGLDSEKRFAIVLGVNAVCLFMDLSSVVAIIFLTDINRLLTELICKTYLVTLVWFGWSSFCYVTMDLISDRQRYRRLVRILTIVTAVTSAATYLLPISIVYDGSTLYTEGLAVVCTYGQCLLYVVASLSVSIYLLRQNNSRRGLAVLLCNSLWVLAAAVQAFNNELLLVGFASAVGVMIMYVVMENPDAHMDRSFGCFTAAAMYEYVDMLLSRGEDFCMLDVTVQDVSALEEKGIRIENEARRIAGRFKKNKRAFLFKASDIGVVVIARREDELKRILSKIMLEARDTAFHRKLRMLYYPTMAGFRDSYDVARYMAYADAAYKDRRGDYFPVTADVTAAYRANAVVEQEIRDALAEDRVEVFYQPIRDVRTGKFPAAEALCRLRLRDGSVMPPDSFIPVAETTGLIAELGERVFTEVCRFLRNGGPAVKALERVEVNLSPVQCDDENLAARYGEIASQFNVNPKQINLEITETAVTGVKTALLDNMYALLGRGFTFALDDFGKGTSNLMYAVEMSVSIIKIDMELTQLYFTDPKARSVVGAILAMAHELKLGVVFEGVETAEQAEKIMAAGADYIQGYHYAKPMSQADYLQFLDRQEVQPVVQK